MKYKKVQIEISMSLSELAYLLQPWGIKVDDLCSATRFGRVVDLWIPEDKIYDADENEHVGYFVGEKP